jgi:chaperonin GroES
MKMKPLGDNVVVIPAAKEEITKSGIVIPDTAGQEKPEQGKVVAVGEGKRLDNGTVAPMSIKVGDLVMFKKYSPDEVKVDGEKYLVLSESDIIAILED